MDNDLKKEAELLHNSNKISLTSGTVKELLPFIVIVTTKKINGTDRIVIGVDWGEDKERTIRKIGEAIAPLKDFTKLIVFSSEMWFTKFGKETSEEEMFKVPPSQHPDRREGVITTAFTPDLKDTYTITQAFNRVNDQIVFEDELVLKGKDAPRLFIMERLLGLYGN